MPHVVMCKESERGWGGEVWYLGYDTLEEAEAEVLRVNSKNTSDTVPSIYTIAKYEGFLEEVPLGFNF